MINKFIRDIWKKKKPDNFDELFKNFQPTPIPQDIQKHIWDIDEALGHIFGIKDLLEADVRSVPLDAPTLTQLYPQQCEKLLQLCSTLSPDWRKYIKDEIGSLYLSFLQDAGGRTDHRHNFFFITHIIKRIEEIAVDELAAAEVSPTEEITI